MHEISSLKCANTKIPWFKSHSIALELLLLFAITSSCLVRTIYVCECRVTCIIYIDGYIGCIYIAISLSCTRSHTGSYLEALVHNMLSLSIMNRAQMDCFWYSYSHTFFLIICAAQLIKPFIYIFAIQTHTRFRFIEKFLGKFKEIIWNSLQNGKFTWTPCKCNVHLMRCSICAICSSWNRQRTNGNKDQNMR